MAVTIKSYTSNGAQYQSSSPLNDNAAVLLSERLLSLLQRSERFFKDDKYMRHHFGANYHSDPNTIQALLVDWMGFREDCVIVARYRLSIVYRLRVKAWIEQADEHSKLLNRYLYSQ